MEDYSLGPTIANAPLDHLLPFTVILADTKCSFLDISISKNKFYNTLVASLKFLKSNEKALSCVSQLKTLSYKTLKNLE